MYPDNASSPLSAKVGVFVLGGFHLSGSGVWWAKGEDLARGEADGDSRFLEYNSVDGGMERRALDVMFEFVLAAFGSASEFAATDLGLGSPRCDPTIAPCSENTGGDSWGGSFSNGDGLFELVVEDGPSFSGFGGIREESVDPGADDNGEIFGEEDILEPFRRSGLSGASFL